MNLTQQNFLVDSLTAGSTSLITGQIIVPPNDITPMHTIYIPLITGILAPLIKEIIITLRENRKRKKEQEHKKPKNGE